MAYCLQETSHIVISNPHHTWTNSCWWKRVMIWSIPKPTGLYILREAGIRLVGWTHMAYALALRIASFLNISMEVPMPSMYGTFTSICLIFMINVGEYTTHGCSGYLWVFILVLHWHYKYVVTVCYEKHGLNKLEKLWRKVIALNIGLIREQARRWDHSWMELSDFDMFYNIQNPSNLDSVLFCVFWMLVLKPSYFLFGFWHSYSRRNVLHQSAVFFHYIEPAYLWKIRTCHPNWWRHLGSFEWPRKFDCGAVSLNIWGPTIRQSSPPKGTAGDSSQGKSITVSWFANLGESQEISASESVDSTGQLRQQTKTAINNKLIIEL